jgi:hypothetical protein
MDDGSGLLSMGGMVGRDDVVVVVRAAERWICPSLKGERRKCGVNWWRGRARKSRQRV